MASVSLFIYNYCKGDDFLDYKDLYISCFESFETDISGTFYSETELEELKSSIAMQRLDDVD